MRVLRIFIRNFRDSLRSVFRNFSLSIASITCITITLILVSLSIVISANLYHFTKNLEEELTIIVYLDEDVDSAKEEQIEAAIKDMDSYEFLEFKSKEEWKAEMQATSSELSATLEYLENGSLPAIDVIQEKIR